MGSVGPSKGYCIREAWYGLAYGRFMLRSGGYCKIGETPYTTRENQDKNTSYFQEYLVSSGGIISLKKLSYYYYYYYYCKTNNFQWETIEEWIKVVRG